MNNFKHRIRILQAIRQGKIGGGETHVLDLVRHLDRSRFEPIVLSFTDGPMIDRLREMDIRCYVIPTMRAFDLFSWGKIKTLLRDEHIDLVHVHGTRAASNLLWASRYSNIPIIYTIHGWSFHDDQSIFTRKLRTLSERYLTKGMDLNISVSESNRQSGKDHFPDFKSVIVNNGIDLAKFNPELDYQDVRSQLNISKKSLLITFIARMTKQKAPIVMLNAFYKVIQQYAGVQLLMVGEGELRQEAERCAADLGISHRVIFENFRQDIPAILKASDIYCLPSLWEGLPIGLLEAMAMGKAVVATNVDGSKEIIVHGQNGLLVEPGSSIDLSSSLLSLCNDSTKRKQLQNSARDVICQVYSIRHMTGEISSLYEDIYLRSNSLSEKMGKDRNGIGRDKHFMFKL
jgi:glycosyltransferase involved in cell wall biosynthesis